MKIRTAVLMLVCIAFSLVVIFLFRLKHAGKATYQTIHVGNTSLSVERAETPEQITQGLSGRDRIGADGMLFVLPEKTIAQFWMKDMYFALDFIWIDTDHVVDITEHVPAPDSHLPLSALHIYAPSVPVTRVLEVPSGFVKDHGVKMGDHVVWQ